MKNYLYSLGYLLFIVFSIEYSNLYWIVRPIGLCLEVFLRAGV